MRNGERIEAVPLKYTLQTGISPNDVRLDFGMISEYEEREAAVFAGSSWAEWESADVRDRAAAVAHMRYHYLIQSHITDAVTIDRDRRQRAANKKAG